MKIHRTWFYITASSLALLAVLFIQVNWIVQTAQIKESLFNEKANMVLSRTTEALGSDEEACRNIEARVADYQSPLLIANLGKNEVRTIDSLFTHFMQFYNFQVDYTFEIIRPMAFTAGYGSGFGNNAYNKRIGDVTGSSDIALKLILPEKKQYIIAEMGPLFVTSVILILVVLFLFWQTTLSLMREKRLSEHTTGFLNNMTHEFKTPLTNIALAGKMITREPSPANDDKVRHYTGIILEENEKLISQVEQVLSMSALERGEIPIHKTGLDFHALLQEVMKRISLQMENRQGEMKWIPKARHYMIRGDRVHLTNALCNLFDNAIKYSGGKPHISVQTVNTGSFLVVEISDQGMGIEKKYQKKIFETYFRVPTGDVHDVKGFGLGLAYVKKIIELHGGTIALESEKGRGSTFTIQLPYE